MLDLLELPLLLGGLGVFIFAIGQLSEVLREAFTDEARETVKKYTRHILASVVIGAVVTVLFGSSSAAIILTIVLINAGALDVRNAIGIILGANVGTTVSSQLIALDVTSYSYIAVVLGLAITMVTKRERWQLGGRVLLYLGLLFFGLYLMEHSVAGLEDSEQFAEWLSRLDNPVTGALTGGLVTLIIQSSSATVGMAVALGEQGSLALAGGLAVMLGAELGTCSDTLVATIGGKRAALKAGIFHVVFNLICIALGLLLFDAFVGLVERISGGQDIDRQIANGHLLFNLMGVVLFLPLVGPAVKVLEWVLPERGAEG